MSRARELSKLLSTSNGKIAGGNLDVSFENITDTGTEGTRVATGTSAQRGSTAGQLRFNTETGLAEYYTGTAFKAIDAPPTVSSIDVTEVDSQAGGNQTIVITGSNFASGATVTFVGASGTDFNASTVTVDSATQITAVAPKASFLNAQEPYGVKVSNASGLSATLSGQINVDTSPSWSTASGSLGSVLENTSANLTVSATDQDGDTIAYSETGGTVLSSNGLSINSSTGAITGTAPTVSADTTLSFTLRATANSKTVDRAFSIIVNDNPLVGITEYSGMNLENTDLLGNLSSTGNLYYVTNSSDITNVAGSSWTGTKLIKLNDGGVCGQWNNIINAQNSSGGTTIVMFGRADSNSTTGTPSGSVNENNVRPYDAYGSTGEFWDFQSPNGTNPNVSHNVLGVNSFSSLVGQSYDLRQWHFFAFRYSSSIRDTGTQTFKFTTNVGNTLYHTSGTGSNGAGGNNAGFMGFDPTGSGNNNYNWEGWTGGWRMFQANLSDAQISFLFNNGAGRY